MSKDEVRARMVSVNTKIHKCALDWIPRCTRLLHGSNAGEERALPRSVEPAKLMLGLGGGLLLVLWLLLFGPGGTIPFLRA
jgi:hypothetical protein